MNYSRHLHLSILLPVLFIIACGRKATPANTAATSKLRVLGYLTSSANWIKDINAIDLSKITDLNLAFINPDSTGKFSLTEDLHTVIQRAHENNVRVFASIGGGNAPLYIAGLMKVDKRVLFIKDIIALAVDYNFDGIDVDIENELITDQYAPFVYELSNEIKPRKKLLTAALASWNGENINDTTLQQYDFINVMSYDKTGPWDTTRPGQHSPYTMIENDFNYFHYKRNIPANKLFMGLPFYGYGFGGNAPSGLSYKQIIAAYPGFEDKDEVNLPDGGTIYYNGRPTIKNKTIFAKKNKAGGVMIWQLLGDTTGSFSLLDVINNYR